MKKTKFSSNLVIIILIIYLLIPLVATAIYSMFQKWTGILPEGFTLGHYASLLSNEAFLLTLGRTIIISIVPIVLTVLVTLLALICSYDLFPQIGKVCPDPLYDSLHHSGSYLICQYPLFICWCWRIFGFAPGDADRRLLYHHSSLYLSGHSQQHACYQYAHAHRSC